MARRRRRNRNIANNSLSRVFIYYDCIDTVEYIPCLSVGEVAASVGDPVRIECPSPDKLGSFIEVGIVPGEITRYTSTMTVRMTRDNLSLFRKLFNEQCSFNLVVAFGTCERPDKIRNFEKLIFFQNINVTSYSTDPLSVLSSGDRAIIEEVVDITFESYHEILPYIDLSLTRIEDSDANSFSFLFDNTVSNCISCIECTCNNVALSTNGITNIIASWQNNKNNLVMVNDAGVITVLNTDKFLNDDTVAILATSSLPLNIGETITSGTHSYVGTNDGRIFYIDDHLNNSVIQSTTGVEITSLYHKLDCDVIAGNSAGGVYWGTVDGMIESINSPTVDSVTAVADCGNFIIIGTSASQLFYNRKGQATWQLLDISCDDSAILSIECCNCISFFVGTEEAVYYSLDAFNSLTLLNNDYINYKHILCCPSSDAVTILSEDGNDIVILTTEME